MHIRREVDGFVIYVGQWACRYSWSQHGRFSNDSRWFSGWHKWREYDDPIGC